MKEYSRKFGKQRVTISENGKISIVGEWVSNHGLIYPHMIPVFKSGAINPVTGLHYQVIGMDNDIRSEKIKTWIYDKIRKGLFDHLIKEL